MNKTKTALLALCAAAALAFTACSSGDDDEGGGGRGNDMSKYKTVDIGGQTWMAENLDYAVAGSVCYDGDTANCGKYGRLYDWETANTVCPSGWLLPTKEDWDELFNHAGGRSAAGKRLKAKNGWNDYEGKSGNGTDDYDFAALPGGGGSDDGVFHLAGDGGFWWSAYESDSDRAYYCGVGVSRDDIFSDFDKKANLFSVRCLKDNGGSL